MGIRKMGIDPFVGAKEAIFGFRKYSTPIGTMWVFITMVFRVIPIGAIGAKLYHDGHKEFTCDTKMPGCEVVCYSEYLPMTLDRFWHVELIFILSPSIFFYAFASYQASKYGPKKEKKEEE